MKAAIVYCSQTGHTEKYARWLADRLGCEATPFAKRASVDLDAIDVLVFCSWFHAASIKGSKWLKREMAARPGLDVVLLATGATPMPGTGWSNEEEIERAFRRLSLIHISRRERHGVGRLMRRRQIDVRRSRMRPQPMRWNRDFERSPFGKARS